MSKRPEKNLKNPPGQIKYDWVKEEKKLNREPKITIPPGVDKSTPKKLTFEEWWVKEKLVDDGDGVLYAYAKAAWKAGQENK